MIALQKPVSHSVICSQCLLLAYWPVSARGAISTGSTWRSLEIKLCYGEWTCYPCKTCTPPFICSQRFLSAYIPVPARDTWSTWRKSLVSWHDSLAEICFSSHYLQPVPPVGLLTGFSKGCNFYLEDVEKEPGDYIVLWWVDMIALQKPVSKFSSRYLQPVPPVGPPTGFSNGCNFNWEYVEKEPGDWIVLGWVDMLSLQKPVLLPLSAASASCRPISRIQQGILGVRGSRAWWVDMIALQKPVSHSVICSQCLLLAYWPVSAMVQFLLGVRGGAWRLNCAMVSGHAILAETCF